MLDTQVTYSTGLKGSYVVYRPASRIPSRRHYSSHAFTPYTASLFSQRTKWMKPQSLLKALQNKANLADNGVQQQFLSGCLLVIPIFLRKTTIRPNQYAFQHLVYIDIILSHLENKNLLSTGNRISESQIIGTCKAINKQTSTDSFHTT